MINDERDERCRTIVKRRRWMDGWMDELRRRGGKRAMEIIFGVAVNTKLKHMNLTANSGSAMAA